jgi:signal transduction histidine kinase
MADLIVDEVDQKIGTVEAVFSEAVSKAYQKEEKAPARTASLEEFKTGQPIVERLFLLQGLDHIRYPVARLLYGLDAEPEAEPLSPSLRSGSTFLQAAQEQEFRRKDYTGALASYRQAFKQADDIGHEGEILSAIARVQRKATLLDDAAETYEKIAREYGRVISESGIPLGLAARLELGSLSRDMDDISRATTVFLEIYRLLIHGEWSLDKAQFEFFAERTKALLQELFSDTPPRLDVDSLRTSFERFEIEETRRREEAERAVVFQENAGPSLEARFADAAGRTAQESLRLTLDIGRFSYFASVCHEPIQSSEISRDIWGMILDEERLREDVIHPLLIKHLAPEDISWVVLGRDGGTVIASENPPLEPVTVRTNFASNFPDWTLEIYRPPPDLVKTFLFSRRGVFSYMFLLIAGILVFGLVLTIRTVSREMELARMKSDFVSTISHEFKSPLTSIRQLAEMLHSGRIPSEERRQKYYDVLLEQSERLTLLTDNILSLAKIEEGRKEYRFEPADLSALLREVISSIRDRMGHEGFEIGWENDEDRLIADIDREAVSQALANLLDNAVKYSGESRRIDVRMSVEGEDALITVQDFGIGISKDEQDRVFDRFYRGGDELTRTVKGTGLGLSLVKEIVEAHRGSVHVDSEPGKGSTFSIRLPTNRPEED